MTMREEAFHKYFGKGGRACNQNFLLLFSSPEHKGGPLSVVSHLSPIFSSQTAGPICTKLCRNVLSEVLFKNCSKNLISSKTLVAMAMKLHFIQQFFKNLHLWNGWSNSEIISQECSLGDPFQNWL